ncbi:hypothetical protein M433DRAFT_436220 [Acidomyces richmondensis BFW]|nr:MAG: hypothetical protein FE78DRAFT_249639 [Acidomyces sp. 'richmondensis']KYG42051.1 hypothetical protein M433DRAFT_436220 [Acidomyces richmondensis BFW]
MPLLHIFVSSTKQHSPRLGEGFVFWGGGGVHELTKIFMRPSWLSRYWGPEKAQSRPTLGALRDSVQLMSKSFERVVLHFRLSYTCVFLYFLWIIRAHLWPY